MNRKAGWLCATLVLLAPFLPASELLVDRADSRFAIGVKASPPHSFEVLLTNYEAAISLDAQGEVEAADFSFHFADLESDNAKRDKKMRAWMDIESYPDVQFTLNEVRGEGAHRVAVGDVAMHGLSRTLEVPFTLSLEGSRATVRGSATIDHRDWGLDIISLFIFKVKPELTINFTLSGALQN